MPANEMLLSTDDLAERWQVSFRTVEDWRLNKTGPPYVKVGRLVRYRLPDVERWEADRKQLAVPA